MEKDIIDDVAEEFTSLSDLQHSVAESTDVHMTEMIRRLREAAAAIAPEDGQAKEGKRVLAEITGYVKGTTTELNKLQKTLHGAGNKYGKILERRFDGDSDMGDVAQFDARTPGVQESIAVHLLSTGQFDLADKYATGGNSAAAMAQRSGYILLNDIISSLHNHDVLLALEWATAQREALLLHTPPGKPSLLFQLHSLRYLQLLNESIPKALAYAQASLSPHATGNEARALARLMSAAIYVNRPGPRRYGQMGGPKDWGEAERGVREGFCRVSGIAGESPLSTTLSIGVTALPPVLKVSRVKRVNKAEWTTQDELPVEIPLPDSALYHSVFVCPVTKEQSSESNPPMRLPCGHVMSQESIHRMAKGSSVKVKCPYCPTECVAKDAVMVYF